MLSSDLICAAGVRYQRRLPLSVGVFTGDMRYDSLLSYLRRLKIVLSNDQ